MCRRTARSTAHAPAPVAKPAVFTRVQSLRTNLPMRSSPPVIPTLTAPSARVVEHVHHHGVGQIEAVGGAVLTAANAGADLLEPCGYFPAATDVSAEPAVASAWVGLQGEVARVTHLSCRFFWVMPLLQGCGRIPAVQTAVSPAADVA